ncbi:cytochrome P450, putative [Ricinus communis]|uniref:Cytochrome P450, putative n=1 Tax=Ricinus communis TaxID=3988 RepID=B9SG18_RICCO|nr:cytochrome P450, putative [Ricinus communis]
MRMVTGKRYGGNEGEGTARQFREMIREIFKYAEASYPGDFLPILQWIDYQGYLKKVKELGKRCDDFLQVLIDGHRNSDKGSKTMISHLLSLQESEPEYYSDEIIKGLILDIVFGGTESSALTIEWAMANLLNNPQVLQKAKNELDIQIGNATLMDELDLSKLPYLQNIISETVRLYPVGPLLLPHFSNNDCTLEGYNVPKNTILFVNSWAIQRDPKLWDDAEEFKPERFECGGQDDQAYNYRFMLFGLGRRACPGMGLANRVVGFALGSMIQCFEWKRVSDIEIDMIEGTGLAMPKAEPLVAMSKARDIIIKASNMKQT